MLRFTLLLAFAAIFSLSACTPEDISESENAANIDCLAKKVTGDYGEIVAYYTPAGSELVNTIDFVGLKVEETDCNRIKFTLTENVGSFEVDCAATAANTIAGGDGSNEFTFDLASSGLTVNYTAANGDHYLVRGVK